VFKKQILVDIEMAGKKQNSVWRVKNGRFLARSNIQLCLIDEELVGF
jgi:hypothetical protein